MAAAAAPELRLATRLLLQTVDAASLLVGHHGERVMTGRALIAYVCFLRAEDSSPAPSTDSNSLVIQRAARAVLDAPLLFEDIEGQKQKRWTVGKFQDASVLVVPQATLAGKLKNKRLQYHAGYPKAAAEEAYGEFVRLLRAGLDSTAVVESKIEGVDRPKTGAGAAQLERFPWLLDDANEVDVTLSDSRVQAGTYGHQQSLRMDCPGPYTHSFEF
jgi:D-Tyr-tRNAtyr deacylase